MQKTPDTIEPRKEAAADDAVGLSRDGKIIKTFNTKKEANVWWGSEEGKSFRDQRGGTFEIVDIGNEVVDSDDEDVG